MGKQRGRPLHRIALLLALMLLLVAPISAVHADPLIVPRPQGTAAYSSPPPLYDDARFDAWAYTFEGQEWSSSGYVVIYFWMNELLIAKAWVLKFAFRMVDYSVTDLVFRSFLGRAEAGLQSVGEIFWTDRAPHFAGALAVCGIWALLLYARGRVSRAWGALGGTVLVLISTAVMLTAGGTVAAAALETAHGLTHQVYGAVQRVSQGGDLLASSGDGVWRTMVYEPWLTGELSEHGQTTFRSKDGLDGGEFLALSVADRRSLCLYNPSAAAVDCPWWGVDFLPRRMFLTLWTALATVIYGGTFVALAGGILLSQVTVLFCLLSCPILLLIALWWPEGGARFLRRTIALILGALLRQVLLSAMLAGLLLFSQQLRSQLADLGWMLQSVVLVIMAGAAFRFRNDLLSKSAGLFRREERQAAGQRVKLEERIRHRDRKAPAAEGAVVAVEQLPSYGTLHGQPEVSQPVTDALRAAETVHHEAAEHQRLAFQRELRVLQLRLQNRDSTFSEWAQGAGKENPPQPAAGRGTARTKSPGDDLAALALHRAK